LRGELRDARRVTRRSGQERKNVAVRRSEKYLGGGRGGEKGSEESLEKTFPGIKKVGSLKAEEEKDLAVRKKKPLRGVNMNAHNYGTNGGRKILII